MLRFSLGVIRKDKIRNEWAHPSNIESGQVRTEVKAEMVRFCQTSGWDDDYMGKKVLEMRYLDVMKEDMQELGAETICVCPKAMETPLWQPLMGKPKEEVKEMSVVNKSTNIDTLLR